MAGVLDGVKVLDLTWGISGPMATMLFADHGAVVTKIEPPDGDPFRSFSGSRVWRRGKRSAVLDLTTAGDRAVLLLLVEQSDVLVESYGPGVAKRLGVDQESTLAVNPRLIHCSITGYGETGKHADRPAFDALVAARTGQQWEHRGVVGGTISHISGGGGLLPGVEPPDEDCWIGPPREGPLFGGVPWASVAAGYLATLAISAALRAREITGRGQHVHTSLLQGVLQSTVGGWQRAERHDAPAYQSWIIDPRAPKGFFRSSDGRWLHHWVPLPSFIFGTSEGDRLEVPTTGESTSGWKVSTPRQANLRIGMDPEDMHVLHTYNSQMSDAVAKFPAADWLRVAAEVGVPVQIVRSPEEALLDADLVADGCVAELNDPELGPIRQVGQVYRLSACPDAPLRPAVPVGHDTEAVRQEAGTAGARPTAPRTTAPAGDGGRSLSSPLAGIRVVDLGLAVAGPYGTQLLADLGADVIKVNTLHDAYWFGTHIAMCCNRGKRSISLNLKDPRAMEVLQRLIATADIVQHNMRYDAAVRLGVDYESLRKVKPDLIYCHTRGFERSWREKLPGNDQTGAALAGTDWLDGGLDDDGKPIWSVNSLGDTGNGLLSAIGMVQALYHRDRTGEGQFVDTSIIYAHLLNASMAWITPDGATSSGRPSLDRMQLGWGALYRLYPTGDGWLCLAALTDDHWARLCGALQRDDLLRDARFAEASTRLRHDTALEGELERIFAGRSAQDWFKLLDDAGVPCEVSSTDFVHGLFDDEEMIEKGWVASYDHHKVGKLDVFGLLFDLDQTPGKVQGPPPQVGAHTRAILAELGYAGAEIETLVQEKAALAV